MIGCMDDDKIIILNNDIIFFQDCYLLSYCNKLDNLVECLYLAFRSSIVCPILLIVVFVLLWVLLSTCGGMFICPLLLVLFCSLFRDCMILFQMLSFGLLRLLQLSLWLTLSQFLIQC